MLYLACLIVFVFAMLCMAIGVALGKPPLAPRCKPQGACCRMGQAACRYRADCGRSREAAKLEP
jgi:hypothetical protein